MHLDHINSPHLVPFIIEDLGDGYIVPNMEEIRKAIKEWHDDNHPKIKLNKTPSNYRHLTFAILKSKLEKDQRYLRDLHKGIDHKEKRQRERIIPIIQFLANYLKEKDKIVENNLREEATKSASSNKEPFIEQEVQAILEKLDSYINGYSLEGFEDIYKEGVDIARKNKNIYSKAKLDIVYAKILVEKENAPLTSKFLCDQAISVLKDYNQYDEIKSLKYFLAQIELEYGDLILAEIYINDYLYPENENSDLDKLFASEIVYSSIEHSKGNYMNALKHLEKAEMHARRLCNDKSRLELGENNLAYHDLRKAIIFESIGQISEAKLCYLKAIPFLRKNNNSQLLCGALLNLALLEIEKGGISSAKAIEYINEAKNLCITTKRFVGLAHCVASIANIAFKFGYTRIATELIKEGENTIRQTSDKNALSFFIVRICNSLIQSSMYLEVKRLVEELFEITDNWGYLILGYSDLASIHQYLDSTKKTEDIMNVFYTRLENEINKETSVVRKAELLGYQANILFGKKEYKSGLDVLYKAKKIYADLNYLGPLSITTLDISEIEIRVSKNNCHHLPNEWLALDKTLKGTSFYFQQTRIKIYLGTYYYSIREYSLAHQYLKDAKYLNDKYGYAYSLRLSLILELVKEMIQMTEPLKVAFDTMIDRLHEGIQNMKAQPGEIIRFWYHKYLLGLKKIIYKSKGLNAALFSDSEEEITNISSNLRYLFDFFWIVANTKYEDGKKEIFQYPFNEIDADDKSGFYFENDDLEQPSSEMKSKIDSMSEKLVENMSIDAKISENGFIKNPDTLPKYILVLTNDVTARYVMGSNRLPEIAYAYLENKSSIEIKKDNKFVLPFVVAATAPKFELNLDFCKKFSLLPIYIDAEPATTNIVILDRIIVKIPYRINVSLSEQKILRKVLTLLMYIKKEIVKPTLATINLELQSISRKGSDLISASVLICEFYNFINPEIYPVLILHLSDESPKNELKK